jgi:hypothetical protein
MLEVTRTSSPITFMPRAFASPVPAFFRAFADEICASPGRVCYFGASGYGSRVRRAPATAGFGCRVQLCVLNFRFLTVTRGGAVR